MVLHRPVELAQISGTWHTTISFQALRTRIDEVGCPDYHAACYAGPIVPPFCALWVAPLRLFFRRRRTDLSGRMEQGAGPDFWPHGVCGGHRARCFHGRAGRRERMARPVERE